MPYWLVKSEPESFSIHHLAAALDQATSWDGVRNYQARNFMRSMKVGDLVLFYHSSTEPLAVMGIAVVVREAYADHTAWDPKNDHYDPKASRQNPIWDMVDMQLQEVFRDPVTLDALRANAALDGLELLRRGSRLSVHPVSEAHFQAIVEMAGSAAAAGSQGGTPPATAKPAAPQGAVARKTAVRKGAVQAAPQKKTKSASKRKAVRAKKTASKKTRRVRP